MSGNTVASAAIRRRQRLSIPKIALTSASKTLHDQFGLIHRHQTTLRGCRCDRLMVYRLILDENIEHEVLHRLDNYGHTVEHVDFVPELGKGTADHPIAQYSLENDRVME